MKKIGYYQKKLRRMKKQLLEIKNMIEKKKPNTKIRKKPPKSKTKNQR